MTSLFISRHTDTTTASVAVRGLIICGKAGTKRLVAECPDLDPRLRSIIVHVCETSHGGEAGLEEAIAVSKLPMEAFVASHEQRLLATFNKLLAMQSGAISLVSLAAVFLFTHA
eukprot:m.623628 g.623628  ORF g.623628 m.623628 type:complete len:114 (+) comp58225_c0_seq2:80-421(+)